MRDRLAAEEMKEDHELPATVQHSDGVLNRGGRRSRRVRMLTHGCVPHFPVRSCGFNPSQYVVLRCQRTLTRPSTYYPHRGVFRGRRG